MAVIDPVKLTISNYPEGETEIFKAPVNQENSEAGFRDVPFSRELFIEREDFMEIPSKKYFTSSETTRQITVLNSALLSEVAESSLSSFTLLLS